MDERQPLLQKKKIWIIVAVAVIVAAAATVGLFWNKSNKGFKFDAKAQEGAADTGKTKDKADKNIFLISINTMPEFADGKSEGNLKIENDPRNNYVMKVEIRKDQDNDLIYTSDGIKPGQVIKKDKLDKELEFGQYPCTATFTAYDAKKDYQEVGKAAAKLNIYINK